MNSSQKKIEMIYKTKRTTANKTLSNTNELLTFIKKRKD